MRLVFRSLLFVVALAMSPAVWAGEVTVYAAASLKTALDEVARGFADETGHAVILSYAGSSTVARHVVQGAPFDLVMTANVAWMDHVEQAGRLESDCRVDLLGNSLVLIAPAGGGAEPPNRVAMALVDAVPAGIYGKAALQHEGLWEAFAPKVVQTDNVRAALRLVAIGEADLGVVYASDAQAEPRVQVTRALPPESHPPILYPIGIVAGQAREEVVALADYLTSDAALSVFRDHGFAPLPEAAQ